MPPQRPLQASGSQQHADRFPKVVSDNLFKRVGGRCSNPRCGVVTSGPAEDPGKSVNLGEAAHITAASPGGPRYDPSLIPAERASAENGIWLCKKCARLIDVDQARFTVQLLRSWKRDAEKLARKKLEHPGASHHDLPHTDLAALIAYLESLIGGLNSDPWPTDTQLRGPRLTPAAIERKLRVRTHPGPSHPGGTSSAGDEEAIIDADELAGSCTGLVILGGPGSGKTWLARRVARQCARRALEALDAGADPDDIELPLYATCSMLARARGGIREAVVAAALDEPLLPDTGPASLRDTLRGLFTERTAPVLLVLDSIDEARYPDERLRQADTLKGWRIVVTSRPSSWNQQIQLTKDDPRQQAVGIQPLTYPGDVNALIATWFAETPEKGEALAAEIGRRPGLQQAATVPLILAFYCIVTGDGPIPKTRHELYEKVIRRLLAGFWRPRRAQPDTQACITILQQWAWQAASKHPVSGVGTWTEEFRTGPASGPVSVQAPADPAVLEAVGHIAVPLGPCDVDDGTTTRRFIHRSIREHLVAAYLATVPPETMPHEEVADELLHHIWFDVDWEHAAPAALAMHPARDLMLRRLLDRVTGGYSGPGDIEQVDGCFEICRFLSEAAVESLEGEWAPESVEVIRWARRRIAFSSHDQYINLAPGWARADAALRGELIGRLGDANPVDLALETLIRLCPAPDELARLRNKVVGLISRAETTRAATDLAGWLVRNGADETDRALTKGHLRELLAAAKDAYEAWSVACAIDNLGPDHEDRRRGRIMLSQADLLNANSRILAVSGYAWLAQDAAESTVLRDLTGFLQARDQRLLADVPTQVTDGDPHAPQAMADYMVDAANAGRLVLPDHPFLPITFDAYSHEGRKVFRETFLRMMEGGTDYDHARSLARVITGLDPDAAELRRAQRAMRRYFLRENDVIHVVWIALTVAELDPDPGQGRNLAVLSLSLFAIIRALREERLGDVVGQVDATLTAEGALAGKLLSLLDRILGTGGKPAVGPVLAALPLADPSATLACMRFLARVAGEVWQPVIPANPGLGADDYAEFRRTLLGMLEHEDTAFRAAEITRLLVHVQADEEERERAGQLLLSLASELSPSSSSEILVWAMAEVCPPGQWPEARRYALHFLEHTPWIAFEVTQILTDLGMTAAEREWAADRLLVLLSGRYSVGFCWNWARALGELTLSPDQMRSFRRDVLWILSFRDELLRMLDRDRSGWPDLDLAGWLTSIFSEPGDLRRVRQTILRHLHQPKDSFPIPTSDALHLAEALAALNPEPDELAEARAAVLAVDLWSGWDPHIVSDEIRPIEKLNPQASDLNKVRALRYPWFQKRIEPVARRNSDLDSWIEVLPALPPSLEE
jgi:hypothetical protein